MKHNCVYCKYKTNHRGTFNRHLETMKHSKNKKNYLLIQKYKNGTNVLKSGTNVLKSGTNVLKSGTNVLKSEKNSTNNSKKAINQGFECNLCNYCCIYNKDYIKHCRTKNHKNMTRLSNVYEKKLNFLKKKTNIQLQKNQKALNDCKNKIDEQTNNLHLYKKEITNLKIENKELLYKNESLESKISLLSEMKDMCKKGKKSVMNIIINNYNNAPDFTSQPINDMSNDDLKHYIDMGIPTGIVKMLKDHYMENIPNEKRSIWCLDASRVKYLVRHNNNWIVDLMGKIIKNTVIKPLQTKISNMLNTPNESLSTHTTLEYLTNINDLMDKNKNNQILKNASNYFMLKS